MRDSESDDDRAIGNEAQETTPILRYRDDEDVEAEYQDSEVPIKKPKGRRSELFIVGVLAIVIFALGTGDELIQPAQTRVLESIYCKNYYAIHDPSYIVGPSGVPEELCKNAVIQGQVAFLKGWLATIEAFVCLLVAVPWGYAADIYGRRRIVILIIASLWTRAAWQLVVCWADGGVDLRWIWAAAITDLFGGGSAVANAMVFTILADVVPETRRCVLLGIRHG